MSDLRVRGVRGYVTMNTLVFPSEMPALVRTVERIAAAGVDAVLVQDLGVARLVREVCPGLEVHASTQMSLTSAETIAVAAELGLSRVVLARELSVREIAKITAATDMPVEVFIHGALCVAYSGQCLTSESLGGRSANRGQCAQACRLPYELIVDGEDRDLGDQQYLLSPQDLAGYAMVDDLIDAGVASLKIEGRLKTPEYVAGMVSKYRRVIDGVMRGRVAKDLIDADARAEMELSFSRGFSPGWLAGNDHKRLVPGLTSNKRGLPLGRVIAVRDGSFLVRSPHDVRRGDGIGLIDDRGTTGGRVYDVTPDAGAGIWITLGRDDAQNTPPRVGTDVFKNDDPALNKRLRATYGGEDPTRRRGVDFHVEVSTDGPPRLTGTIDGLTVTVVGDEVPPAARTRPTDEAILRKQLGRLGGTPFELRRLTADIGGSVMVPAGRLNDLRRRWVEAATERLRRPPPRTIDADAAERLLQPITGDDEPELAPEADRRASELTVLCRTIDQVDAAAASDAAWIYLDFHDVRLYADAISRARDGGKRVAVASVRMQKPGEMGLLRVIPRSRPDAVLARNLAAVRFAAEAGIDCHGDFSLNVTNHLTADWLRGRGVSRLTVSYDLNRDQLSELVDSVPAAWLQCVVHQHMPLFHMEHCVFCGVISPGTDKTNCGRPCDDHVVLLRDRVGAEHRLEADVACRNTLYNATPQSGAEAVPDLIRHGVRDFRIELLDESADAAARTIGLYHRLLTDDVSPGEVWRSLRATNRVGVTRGTLEVL